MSQPEVSPLGATRGHVVVRWLLSLGILVALVSCVNVGAVAATFVKADPLACGLAALLLLLCCLVSAGVWWWLLGPLGCRPPFWQACVLNLVGFFFNSILPSGLGGDVWRAWAFARLASPSQAPPPQAPSGLTPGGRTPLGLTPTKLARPGEEPPDDAPPYLEPGGEGVTLGSSLASVVLERWVAFASLVVVSLLCVPLAGQRLQGIRLPLMGGHLVLLTTLVQVFAFLMLAVLVASWLLMLPRTREARSAYEGRASRLLRTLPPGWGGEATTFVHTVRLLGARPQTLGLALAMNLVSPLLEALAYWLLARALHLQADVVAFLVFTPVLRILHHVPLAMDAAGVQDGALMLAAGAFGWTTEQGLSLSLAMHAARLLVSLVGLPLFVILEWKPARLGFALVGASLPKDHGPGQSRPCERQP